MKTLYLQMRKPPMLPIFKNTKFDYGDLDAERERKIVQEGVPYQNKVEIIK